MSRSARLRAFAVGVLVAVSVQLLQLIPTGLDLTVTLRVGEASAARPFIESELGPVPITRGIGHDGQYSYLVARDPWATEGLADLMDYRWRFRRALLGWLAGGLGLFSPFVAVAGLSAWAAVGLGIACVAAADIGHRLGGRWWASLAVLTNLGLWLSLQLVTADTLALGLGLSGMALVLAGRNGAATMALAGSALAKEVYLVFAGGVVLWLLIRGKRRDALLLAVGAAAPLALWSAWVESATGGGWSSEGNLTVPFDGVVGGISMWAPGGDTVLGFVAIISLVLGVVGVWRSRHSLLILTIGLWTALVLVSSDLVWADGNNIARVTAPMWSLGMLGVAIGLGDRTKELPLRNTGVRRR